MSHWCAPLKTEFRQYRLGLVEGVIPSQLLANENINRQCETLSKKHKMVALVYLANIALNTAMLGAQSPERFKGRLSRLPVDRPTAPQLMGQGFVEATLDGDELMLTAEFEGLSSPVTAAHIHQAPVARRGPVAFTIEVPAVATGELRNTITLTNAQLERLREGLYYLQIHTERNPGGELRGWLLLQ